MKELKKTFAICTVLMFKDEIEEFCSKILNLKCSVNYIGESVVCGETVCEFTVQCDNNNEEPLVNFLKNENGVIFYKKVW